MYYFIKVVVLVFEYNHISTFFTSAIYINICSIHQYIVEINILYMCCGSYWGSVETVCSSCSEWCPLLLVALLAQDEEVPNWSQPSLDWLGWWFLSWGQNLVCRWILKMENRKVEGYKMIYYFEPSEKSH